MLRGGDKGVLDRVLADREVLIAPHQHAENPRSKLPQQVLATQNPAMATVDLKKAYDLSFLQKLKDIGFNTKIGVPAS